jgi:hypothetical protein
MPQQHRPFAAARGGSGRAVTRVHRVTSKDGQKTGLLEQLGELGPIGLTVGPDAKKVGGARRPVPQCRQGLPTVCCAGAILRARLTPAHAAAAQQDKKKAKAVERSLADKAGISMGPISLTYGDDFASGAASSSSSSSGGGEQQAGGPEESIATMTTEAWRAKYEKDGMVDLWVEEEFNSGSRLVVGGARPALPGHAARRCAAAALRGHPSLPLRRRPSAPLLLCRRAAERCTLAAWPASARARAPRRARWPATR